MPNPRRSPYVWPTWICGLLSGESHCEFSAWFRAHYFYDKVKSSFDMVKWNADHAAMVRERADELMALGWTVYIEDQNTFALKGRAATLGGKADIVAINASGSEAKVIDCKTGKPRNKDVWQVLIYMMALPLAVDHCRGLKLSGELQYSADRISIPAHELTPEIITSIRAAIERAAEVEPPLATPSRHECQFCDITAADCPQRIEAEEVVAKTELF